MKEASLIFSSTGVCLLVLKEMLALVQPSQRVLFAIKLWKIQHCIPRNDGTSSYYDFDPLSTVALPFQPQLRPTFSLDS